MYCIHCGHRIADDSRFCTFCGARVTPEDIRAQRVGRVNVNSTRSGQYTKTWSGGNVKSQEQIKQTAQQYQPKKPTVTAAPAAPKEDPGPLSTQVKRDLEPQTRVLGIPMSGKAATSVYLFVLIATILAALFGG